MKPYYEHGGITIYHGDCREVLPTLETAGVVVTDPPYTFGLASTQREGKAGGWADLMNSAAWYVEWLRECKRLTYGTAGAAWVCSSWRSFPILARAACDLGWPIKSCVAWDKEWIGPGSTVLRPQWEQVVLFAHEGFRIADRTVGDVWRVKWGGEHRTGHAAEKPIGLMRRAIEVSGDGRLVLDPFAGSGTTLVAAAMLGRRAIGIEAEERYCEIAAKRLAQEVLPL